MRDSQQVTGSVPPHGAAVRVNEFTCVKLSEEHGAQLGVPKNHSLERGLGGERNRSPDR